MDRLVEVGVSDDGASARKHACHEVWQWLGLPYDDFHPFYGRHGYGDTHAWLGACVRYLVRGGPEPTCCAPVDRHDNCVLREGHEGPHYGAMDVGMPNPLLPVLLRERESGSS